jgi:DNA-binding transcriptional MocR family regulator
MSPAHVLEPTYQAIKQRLMAGQWPPGYHLDTARLADDLGVSKSPVRDSLNHLAGERLVAFEAGVGFHVPRLDETQLKDLLDLNLHLLLIALRGGLVIEPAIVATNGAPDSASQRFLRLARASDNNEIAATVAGIDARLSAVRRLETMVLPEPDAELEEMDHALSTRADAALIGEILTRYHDERKRHAATFVRLLAMSATAEADSRVNLD